MEHLREKLEMAIGPKSMREIVNNLHATQADALLELQQFEFALNEVWRVLSGLADTTQEIVGDLQLMDELKRNDATTLRMIEDRASRSATVTAQIVAAVSEICRAVRDWGIAERGDSGRPRSAILTPPPAKDQVDEGLTGGPRSAIVTSPPRKGPEDDGSGGSQE